MVKCIRGIVVILFVTTLFGPAQAAPAFPVKYSATSRYLVDQNDAPFPIMGRTAWFVLSLSVADYHLFVDDTASRGYSAIELHVINHDPRGNNPPFDGNGDAPFLKRLDGTAWDGVLCCSAPDFTTPNEAYWSFVDAFLSYCESKGILVFMFPAYVGYQGGDQGWMKEIVANGTTRMQSYGAWIATRYKNQKNLVWMMGGDMGTSPYTFNATQTSVENALLTGLKSVTGQQSTLFSAEWVRRSIATDQTTFGTSMTLNGVYSSSDDVNTLGRRAYAYSPIEPAFLLEEPYDQEGPDGNGFNGNATQPVRRFQWWGWLSAVGGYISGNGYVWPFRAPAWRDHLDTQGTRDMARLNAFMGSIAWYNLVPSGLSGMRTLITAGGSSVSLSAYVAAAAAPNGTLMVAYIPPDHTGSITVDMGVMNGPTRARWFDPTSGTYTSIGTGLANTGSRSFTPPGNNSRGEGDWVLLLDTSTGTSPALPTISDIPNQSTTVNTPTAPIPFTIGDADTPAGSLTLSKGSSNPLLVPTNNIVFGGTGTNRTVTATPVANQTGTATITVSVTDGTGAASDPFVLTVNAVNTPPTISSIANQTIGEDTSTGPISFTVGDAETAAGSLTLSKGSSNPNLVPTNNIVFGGSGANRTVTVTPAANQTGSATITGTVSDGQYSASTDFVVAVTAQPAGLVAAYGFNEGTGTMIADASGNGITGVVSGAAWTTGGRYGSALSFNGSSSYVDLGNPTSLQLTGSMTLSAWVKAAGDPANDGQIIAKSDKKSGWQLKTSPDTGPQTFGVAVSSGANARTQRYSTTVRSLNVWYHVASVYNAAARTLDVYVNGVLDNGTLRGSMPGSQIDSTVNVNIGRRSEGYYFNGIIDEVRVYKRALSPAEIQADMNTPVAGLSSPSQPPTISDIPDQLTAVNTPITSAFIINDADTLASSLILHGNSSNPALVTTNNIVFGGSGTNRTVTVAPAANQTGSATITVNVSDGQYSTNTSFAVSVAAQTAGTVLATYGFNEGTGATAADGSGNGITGSINGAAWTSGGKYRSALSFDGSSSFVDLGNPSAFQITGSMTLSAWVKATADPSNDGQIVAKSDSASGWQLKTSPDTGPRTFGIAVSGAVSGRVQRYSTTVRSLNVWYHVAGVYNASSRALDIYVNGVLDNGTLRGTVPASQINSTVNANIGRRTSGYYFNGIIDEVRIYDRALNAGEIQNDMNSSMGLAASQADVSSPVVSPQISSITVDAQGTVQVTVSGAIGFRYALEASSDRVTWTEVDAQDNNTGSIVFSEVQSTNSIRFYRAVSK